MNQEIEGITGMNGDLNESAINNTNLNNEVYLSTGYSTKYNFKKHSEMSNTHNNNFDSEVKAVNNTDPGVQEPTRKLTNNINEIKSPAFDPLLPNLNKMHNHK